MSFKTIEKTLGLTLIAAGVILAPVAVQAQGRHPHYLSARSDLRRAQFLLRVREEPNVTRNLKMADDEVEAAVHEIDRAAVIDHKDLDEHPPVDVGIPRADRFKKIVELLRSARADMEREEDNPAAREWRAAAFRHIDAALEAVHRASKDAKLDHLLGF
jgi:hypothetical protein